MIGRATRLNPKNDGVVRDISVYRACEQSPFLLWRSRFQTRFYFATIRLPNPHAEDVGPRSRAL